MRVPHCNQNPQSAESSQRPSACCVESLRGDESLAKWRHFISITKSPLSLTPTANYTHQGNLKERHRERWRLQPGFLPLQQQRQARRETLTPLHIWMWWALISPRHHCRYFHTTAHRVIEPKPKKHTPPQAQNDGTRRETEVTLTSLNKEEKLKRQSEL